MRLIVAADIHGFYSKWRKIKKLLNENDHLAIAGDLFDTRYGSYSDPDYQPDKIRQDIRNLHQPLHYVYGNCDQSSYLKGYDVLCCFNFAGHTFLMTHGHISVPVPEETDVVIQGHSHERKLIKSDGIIYVNPGSIAKPRDGVASYGIITDQHISLVSKSDDIIANMMLDSSKKNYANIFNHSSTN